eukprot:3382091-Prymnesium_polylepis.1
MVRRKAVLGRYAVLRCLWHEVRGDERSNRQSSCAVRVALVRQYKKRGAGSTLLRKASKGCVVGRGPADTRGGENATWRPGEEEEAT